MCFREGTARALELLACRGLRISLPRARARNIVKAMPCCCGVRTARSGSRRFWVRALRAIAVPVDDAAARFARRIGAQCEPAVLCPRSGVVFDGIATERVPTVDPPIFLPRRRRSAQRFRPAKFSLPTRSKSFSRRDTPSQGSGAHHANVSQLVRLKPRSRIFEVRASGASDSFSEPAAAEPRLRQFLGCFCLRCLAERSCSKTPSTKEVMATIVANAFPCWWRCAHDRIFEAEDRTRSGDAGGREKFATRYAKAANQHFLRRWWTFRDVRRQFGWKFWP